MTRTLDIREIAQDWRDCIDDGQTGDDLAQFVSLCGQLGCDADPDALERQGEDYSPTLIHDDDFADYARELAEDIGAVDPDASWPLMHIDWDAAADALKIDYTDIEFEGDTYQVRA